MIFRMFVWLLWHSEGVRVVSRYKGVAIVMQVFLKCLWDICGWFLCEEWLLESCYGILTPGFTDKA